MNILYSDCSLFSWITLMMDAATTITTKGHRLPGCHGSDVISRYPHTAGKIFPRYSRNRGSRFAGNMMPDSIMDGKKISCANMVNRA